MRVVVENCSGWDIFALIQLIGLGPGALTHRVLGMILTPSGYGTYGLILTFTTVARTLLASGIPKAASRFVAISPQSAVSVSGKIRAVQLKFTLAVFLSYIAVAPMAASFLVPRGDLGVVFLAALTIPVESLNIFYFSLLNGLREYHKQGHSRLVYFLFKSALMIALVYRGYQVSGAIAGFILGSGAFLLLEYVYWKGATRDAGAQKEASDTLTKQVLSFSAPLIIHSTMDYILNNVDMFILNAFVNAYDLGIYFAAKNISLIPHLILLGAYAAFFPTLSEMHNREDHSDYLCYSRLAMKFLIAIILPAILFMVSFSDTIVVLVYGTTYSMASLGTKLLSVGFLVSSATAFAVILMLSTGHSRRTIEVTAISLAAHLAVSVLIVPIYGIEGAAIAWIIASLVGFCVVSCLLSYMQIGVIPWKDVGKSILAIAPTIVIMLSLWSFNLYLGFLLSLVVYLTLLLLIGVLTRYEITYFLKSILGTGKGAS